MSLSLWCIYTILVCSAVQTPFKLTGLEGRGEAEILKLLFLVADQPLDDERITAEQVEELKGRTFAHI